MLLLVSMPYSPTPPRFLTSFAHDSCRYLHAPKTQFLVGGFVPFLGENCTHYRHQASPGAPCLHVSWKVLPRPQWACRCQLNLISVHKRNMKVELPKPYRLYARRPASTKSAHDKTPAHHNTCMMSTHDPTTSNRHCSAAVI